MKVYERKLKIEIITVIVTIAYFFMLRDDNTLVENIIILSLFTTWVFFAFAYHLWDLKRRNLTLNRWFKSLSERCGKGKVNVGPIYKLFKFSAIAFSVLIILLLIMLIVIGLSGKVKIEDLIINAVTMISFWIASLECMSFLLAAILRVNKKVSKSNPV
ncbi:hypothetical protein [Clostridium sp. B9]|uniref:hypothetical protein n=1 Tax=Clostridium sp. B9 TaxID=3423224 RepID=UPI003D2F1327